MRMLTVLVFILFVTLHISAQGTQLLRQPTLSQDAIVFVYANDLWKTSLTGGAAIRLTSDEGYEFSPHFSHDGQMIAFSAEYDGNTDVYLINAHGGEPKRLTYHPGTDVVQGWTPDGAILFRSDREGRPTETNKFYTIYPNEVFPNKVEIPRAAYGEISPDGKYIAYVPITFWDPEWRNYRGGQAMPIWIVNRSTKELITTPQPTKERHLDPVWHNDKVYYISERDYTSNIWSFDPTTRVEEQITFYKKFDVKSLDAHTNGIVYEQGGYIHLMDLNNKSAQQLEINVSADLNFSRIRWEDVSANDLSNPNISPNAKRVLFEHRGDIFSIPKEDGSWRNITNSSNAADRYPIWSPVGDKIAWFSDKSGEYQLTIADQYGKIEKSISIPNPTFYFQPDWSKDGKHIAFTDTDYNIWLVNTESGKSEIIATDRYAHPNRSMNPIWSPDGKWIAYARQLESNFKAIFIYNINTKKTTQITDGIADAMSPSWDENGKYLYFLASTNYGLQSGWLDMSSYDPAVTRSVYAAVLSSSEAAPHSLKSDEEEIKEPKSEDNEKVDDKKEASADVSVTIDLDGIQNRIVALKIENRNYVSLSGGPKGTVFVAEQIPNERGFTLHKYETEKEKIDIFSTNIQEYEISTDRKNILLKKGAAWQLVTTSAAPKNGDEKLDTNLKIKINPKEEYHQIFKEGWRYMRDFLYVDNVHGAPWQEIYNWYSPWIDHVRHRTDLNYVVDIMSGEVSIGHSYVSGGDMPAIKRVPIGLLGCDFKIENNRYRIAKIYRGENWNPDIYAPLGQPGQNIKEGDYIISINGNEINASQNIYQFLEQTADRIISITVNNTPSISDSRELLIKPVSNERELRSIDWIESNRRKVDEFSNGQIAYVYVPNTSRNGFQSFNRYYFSQQDKKGVIIDERNNGGGSAADYMIDIMSREVLGYFNSKANDNRPWTTPMAGIWGPKVMIINERAGSGGDLLPYMFKFKNLGPLVGTRTWGGLVGTWDTPRFIDGGRMVAPRGGFFDVDGKWAVEGEGISPDIEVIQTPKLVMEGHDPQLEKAVEEALRLLETERFEMKPEPAAPVRWKRPNGYEKD